ncbi:MAG: hypothetical protein AABY87_06795 [bacterium]
MPFALTKAVLGRKLLIDITEEEYHVISTAKNRLFEALYLEQKLDIVVEALRNYVQHRGFPIYKLAYNSERVEKKNKENLFRRIYFWFIGSNNRRRRYLHWDSAYIH